ncbi:lipase secretion chaperone [Lysobacter silvisoli]|uniref:Lipase chaperone n=1 Tax=Lysobacter silvisoli TaxID=2293254 RepID=A0A371K6D4_9GAMM|nr:lipase secretion chaperone [Lysobacter silvisoli]RDZ29410.1 hypothetical protein DX914_10105 [Lysobacter silvisoli]
MRRGWIALAVLAALALTVGGVVGRRALSLPVAAEPADVPVASVPPAAGTRAAPAAAARDSLRDTAVDGAIALDAAGKPRPDRAMRRLFDYFLTRLGERTPAQIRDALRLHLQPQLSAAALAQVLAWFDAYVALERESAALGVSQDLAADLRQRRELRRRRLGEAIAQAWYGEDERRLQLALAKQALAREAGLTPAQREQRLAELQAASGLPPDPTRDESQAVALAMQQSAQFEAQGVAPQQRYAQREAAFGAAAAQRLAELDARRERWNARLADYRAQRQRVLADTALDAAQRQARLDALLAPFDEAERRRLLAQTRRAAPP